MSDLSLDPAALQASATCMQAIGDECGAADTDRILETYFEPVPADGGPTAGQQASGGSCDVAQYTEGTDYRLASDLGASSLLDTQIAALPAERRCIARCQRHALLIILWLCIDRSRLIGWAVAPGREGRAWDPTQEGARPR